MICHSLLLIRTGNYFKFLVSTAANSLCNQCQILDDTLHILFYCSKFCCTERNNLIEFLTTNNIPLDIDSMVLVNHEQKCTVYKLVLEFAKHLVHVNCNII